MFVREEEKWDYAIGMAKIDGLAPSEDLLEMIEREKKGVMTMDQIGQELYKKYNLSS